ncbi:MAG: SRPBCC family protein [Candidatus Sericytochromatia bacterium]|nr:SRPBCC family protein [Candidatus Tanganyikabacteria bacterium]
MKGVFARLLFIAAIIFSLPPLAFLAAGVTAPAQFVVEREKEVLAPPGRVWQVVTDWTALAGGMNKMMPKVGNRKVLGGTEPAAGRVVRYPLEDGRDWDQRILAWDPPRKYEFRNDKGVSAGMPGDVTMHFDLAPAPGGFTKVRYRITVRPEGFVNRSLTHIFGIWLGTLRGYEDALLEVVKTKSEATGG